MSADRINRIEQLSRANYNSEIISQWLDYAPSDFIKTLISEINSWIGLIEDHAEMVYEEENIQGFEISGISTGDGRAVTLQETMEYIIINAKLVEKLLDIAMEYSNRSKANPL